MKLICAFAIILVFLTLCGCSDDIPTKAKAKVKVKVKKRPPKDKPPSLPENGTEDEEIMYERRAAFAALYNSSNFLTPSYTIFFSAQLRSVQSLSSVGGAWTSLGPTKSVSGQTVGRDESGRVR